MKRFLLIFIVGLFLAGCTIEVSDYGNTTVRESYLEIAIASYELGYACGEKHKDIDWGKEKLIKIFTQKEKK